MIPPSQTEVLPRRIAASAIDLGTVLLLWGLVLYRVLVRFQIADRTADGRPIYSQDQRDKLLAIDSGLDTGFVFGDFYYSLHGRGLLLAALCLLIFSVIAWVLIPANTGWSVGHKIMDLRVTDTNGHKPPLDSYLRRYLVGMLDMFPYVIPGLLGWIIASRNDRHQRIGDLSADTVVIDAADVATEEETVLTTTVIRGSEMGDSEEFALEADTAAGETDHVDLTAEPHSRVPTDLDRALAGQSSSSDYPVLDLEDTSPASDFVDSLSDHDLALAQDEADAAKGPSYASEWHFPESADAPVWTPDSTQSNGPASVASARSAATALGASDPYRTEPAGTVAAGAVATDVARSAGLGEPVWNQEWSAWLYWETSGERWLRHDDAQGWVPIEDSSQTV